MNGSLIGTYILCTSILNNILALDPFTSHHPTAVQTSLVAGALFARFDPSGRYVAAGRSNGSAAIWDLDTKAAVRWLEGHVKGVTSVECVRVRSSSTSGFVSWVPCFHSWSRNSRYVLTSSKDWNIIVWDLAKQVIPLQRHTTIRFDAPVASASFHPRNRQESFTRCTALS
jgi:COMPASS component SWD1